MRRKAVSLFLCYLLLCACGGLEAGERRQAKEERSKDSGSGFWGALPYMLVGGGLLAAGLPALGFTGTGIAAHSVASWLMSCSAVANGGGVPAGGLVAVLQSLGLQNPREKLPLTDSPLPSGTFHLLSILDDKSSENQPKRIEPFSEGAEGETQTKLHYTLAVGGATGGSALMGNIGAFLGYTVHKHLESNGEKEDDEEEEE